MHRSESVNSIRSLVDYFNKDDKSDGSPQSSVRSLSSNSQRRPSVDEGLTDSVHSVVIHPEPGRDGKTAPTADYATAVASAKKAEMTQRMEAMLDQFLIDTRDLMPLVAEPTCLQQLSHFCKQNKWEIAATVVVGTVLGVMVNQWGPGN